MIKFVSRAGLKLEHALTTFQFDVTGFTCADLGCNVGGFVDCLLRRGAAKVYAIDTGYGVLDYRLRKDARVVVMERTNAMHATLPEEVPLVTIDVAWTKQRHILPAARKLVRSDGHVITLIKPHYEADASLLRGGVLLESELDRVIDTVTSEIRSAGFDLVAQTTSPIKGGKGNIEVLALLKPATAASSDVNADRSAD